ncbi:MAG: hypothetical protein K6A69_04680 [Lachnospiraceae bacterium]|nr:hypothetical protein [Lachnospiraceae bacterium]
MKKSFYVLLTALILGAFSVTACGVQKPEVDMSDFAIPEDFTWEGSYIDSVVGQAVLTIEKSGRDYHVSIGVPNSDMSHMDTYEFEATYDKQSYGLVYKNGVRTTYDLPDYTKENPGSLISSEVYTDGTGAIYYINGSLVWSDDKDDAGANFSFRDLEVGDFSDEDLQSAEDAFLDSVEYNTDTTTTESNAPAETEDAGGEDSGEAAGEETEAADEGAETEEGAEESNGE